jgi:hypothetical protein
MVMLLILSAKAKAANHYVKPNGNNSNSGHDTTNAFLTIARGMSQTSAAGDTLYIMGNPAGGMWQENNSIEYGPATLAIASKTGSYSNPIVIKAYPGMARPIMSSYPANYTGYGVSVQGSSHVVVDGIEVRYAHRGFTLSSSCDSIIFQNCVADSTGNAGGDNSGGFYLNSCSYIRVHACTSYYNINNISAPESDPGGNDGRYRLQTGGITLIFADHCTIDSNVVYDQKSSQGGIWLKHGNYLNNIFGNTVRNCAAGYCNGVSQGATSGLCEVSTANTPDSANNWYNNIVYHVDGVGIQTAEESGSSYPNKSNKYYNNTLFACGNGGIETSPRSGSQAVTDNQIFNNIVVLSPPSMTKPTATSITNLYLNYDDYYQTNGTNTVVWNGSNYTLANFVIATGYDANSVNSYPVFADTANHDFHLTSGSPTAVKTGGRGGSYPSYMGAYAPTAEPSYHKYYVSKSGNDTNTGTSWAQAWLTVGKLNTTMVHGDTAIFGTGRWLNSQITPPTGGVFAERTVYACSTLSAATQGRTEISSGDSVKTWVNHSGQIYKARWVPVSPDAWYSIPCVVQNDSLLFPVSSIAGITGSGMCYFNNANDTLYARFYNDGAATGREILASARPVVCFRAVNPDHILFFGLTFKMGAVATVFFDGGTVADSVFFSHCKIMHATDYWNATNGNPANVFAGGNIGDFNRYMSFIACTLSSANEMEEQVTQNSGNGLTVYDSRNMIIDSCYFYGLPGVGVYLKNGYQSGSSECLGNVVRNSTFNGSVNTTWGQASFRHSGVAFGCNTSRDSLYGNIFEHITGTSSAAIKWNGLDCSVPTNYGGDYVANNTIYDCYRAINFNGSTPQAAQYIKYNIGYDFSSTSGWLYFQSTNDQAMTVIDSNYWYDPTAAFSSYYAGTAHSWAQWQAHYDTHSFNTNPNLNSPTTDDFRRLNAAREMNQTIGGKAYRIFGVAQDTAAVTSGKIFLMILK